MTHTCIGVFLPARKVRVHSSIQTTTMIAVRVVVERVGCASWDHAELKEQDYVCKLAKDSIIGKKKELLDVFCELIQR